MRRTTPISSTSDALSKAIDVAISGDARRLHDVLARGSNMPGPRANQGLIDAFASECRSRGAKVDRMIFALAALDADAAPGATSLEFLPMCGVAGIAARAASDPDSYARMIAALHDCADDLRFRVRDAVRDALVHIGERHGESLVNDLAPWMDGFFHASCVLSAVRETAWLSQIKSPDGVIARLEEAFALARDAPTAYFRYPGHKALVDALGLAPGAVAARFGVPVFDMLARWSAVKEPVLREAIEKSLGGTKLAARYSADVSRVHAALTSSEPVRRDPNTYVGPTRGRGKKRR